MMKLISSITLALVTAVAPAPAAMLGETAQGRCATALKGNSGLVCREAGKSGVVMGLASAQAHVDEVALAAVKGEMRFQNHFNNDVPQYAILLDLKEETRKSLQAAGFKAVLRWLSPEQKKAMQEAQIRRSVEQQIAGRGLPPAQVEALVQQALGRLGQQSGGDSFSEGGAVTHELGHVLFIESYWPGGWGEKGNPDGQYGSPAPDWLDETAAVLHEDEALTADRRKQFASIYNDRATGTSLEAMSKAKLIDLPTFLTQEHPVNRRARAAAKLAKERGEMPSTGGVLLLSGADAKAISEDGILFYLQARLFADFMFTQTGDPKVFHSIADLISGGGDLGVWLHKNGKKHRLATDIPGLHRQWKAWLEKTVRGNVT